MNVAQAEQPFSLALKNTGRVGFDGAVETWVIVNAPGRPTRCGDPEPPHRVLPERQRDAGTIVVEPSGPQGDRACAFRARPSEGFGSTAEDAPTTLITVAPMIAPMIAPNRYESSVCRRAILRMAFVVSGVSET